MISVKRLRGSEFKLNCELIETLEATPDTTIVLTTGKVYIVSNSIEEVMEQIIKYKQSTNIVKGAE